METIGIGDDGIYVNYSYLCLGAVFIDTQL